MKPKQNDFPKTKELIEKRKSDLNTLIQIKGSRLEALSDKKEFDKSLREIKELKKEYDELDNALFVLDNIVFNEKEQSFNLKG